MNNDSIEVDELILELADYKNDYADMAAEKLLRKCSTSWEAYQYLQDRVRCLMNRPTPTRRYLSVSDRTFYLIF